MVIVLAVVAVMMMVSITIASLIGGGMALASGSNGPPAATSGAPEGIQASEASAEDAEAEAARALAEAEAAFEACRAAKEGIAPRGTERQSLQQELEAVEAELEARRNEVPPPSDLEARRTELEAALREADQQEYQAVSGYEIARDALFAKLAAAEAAITGAENAVETLRDQVRSWRREAGSARDEALASAGTDPGADPGAAPPSGDLASSFAASVEDFQERVDQLRTRWIDLENRSGTEFPASGDLMVEDRRSQPVSDAPVATVRTAVAVALEPGTGDFRGRWVVVEAVAREYDPETTREGATGLLAAELTRLAEDHPRAQVTVVEYPGRTRDEIEADLEVGRPLPGDGGVDDALVDHLGPPDQDPEGEPTAEPDAAPEDAPEEKGSEDPGENDPPEDTDNT